jgi:hypothetical protein
MEAIENATEGVRSRLGGLDSAKAAGLLVIGSVVVLSALRRGFGNVRISVGD